MIELNGVVKRYGDIEAVKDLSLTINKGELITLLGASGCGKTTTLKCITGQHYPDEGQIYIGGKDVTTLPTYKRNIGMVFQNFALFPHKTIYENVEFPLKIRKFPKRERHQRVLEALKLVQLVEHDYKYPKQLSGGQQQRVSLARAMVYQPNVILFDEPLSNLDARLREEMRFEIKDLQKRMQITSIYVTHDQEEALALSDRIAIMNEGVIEQYGTPKEIFSRPKTAFVARFIGLSNFMSGEMVSMKDGRALFKLKDLIVEARCQEELSHTSGEWQLMVRPSQINLLPTTQKSADNQVIGTIKSKTYLGDLIDYRIQINENCVLRVQSNRNMEQGKSVLLEFPPLEGWLVANK